MASRRCWVVIPSCTSAESTYVNSGRVGAGEQGRIQPGRRHRRGVGAERPVGHGAVGDAGDRPAGQEDAGVGREAGRGGVGEGDRRPGARQRPHAGGGIAVDHLHLGGRLSVRRRDEQRTGGEVRPGHGELVQLLPTLRRVPAEHGEALSARARSVDADGHVGAVRASSGGWSRTRASVSRAATANGLSSATRTTSGWTNSAHVERRPGRSEPRHGGEQRAGRAMTAGRHHFRLRRTTVDVPTSGCRSE